MLPAFSLAITAADKPENGLNAKIYQLVAMPDVLPYTNDRYYDIVGTSSGEGGRCSFDDTVRFHNALPWLIKTSKEDTGRAGTGLTGLDGYDYDQDGYLVKWEGTITATNTGDYTLVGRKVDNGFLAYVDQNDNGTFEANEVYYDYASPNHWFDGGNDRLVSQQGAFHLEAGEATAVQFWYYEAGGGEACSINVSTEGGANDKSFGDAGLKLSLDKKVYTSNLAVNHNRIKELLSAGVKADGSVAVDDNGCQANMEGNHHYDDTIDALMAQMFLLEEKVLPNYETAAFRGLGYNGFEYEDSLIDYTGYVTATIGGTYQFGTAMVDNCLMVEIQIDGEWVTVYEFWAKNVWNDNSTTYSDTVVTLEEGKSYPIHVTFLEINGGEAIESRIKVNGEEQSMAGSKLVFTTTEPTAPVKPATVELFGTGSEWYYMTSGEANDQVAPENWTTDADVYGAWAKGTANLSDEWGTNDSGSVHKTIWAAKEFTVDDLADFAGYALAMNINYDDNISLYINGKLVYKEYFWSSGTETWKIANEASDLLVEGTNVIAVNLIQGHGGFGFDMSLNLTTTIAATDVATYINSMDAFNNFVAAVNNAGNRGADFAVVLGADLDFENVAWTPINEFKGQLYGNGYSIKNMTATSTGTGVEGMFINRLNHNGGDKGTAILDGIVFDGCTFNAAGITVGLVFGSSDRSVVRNVTVKNSVINNTGDNAAAIAGDVKWGCGLGHIMGCTVENTTVIAKKTASGLAVYTEVDSSIEMHNNTLTDVTLAAPKIYADVSNKNGTNNITNLTVNNLVAKSTLAAPAEGDYTFYYQTRTGANGTDYRIICVANTEWATSKAAINVKISFTDGNTTVSSTQAADVAYSTVTATGDGYTDVYTAADGTVIFGWVVTGVPADFAANAPTAVVVD